jgi:hypothetical protein
VNIAGEIAQKVPIIREKDDRLTIVKAKRHTRKSNK